MARKAMARKAFALSFLALQAVALPQTSPTATSTTLDPASSSQLVGLGQQAASAIKASSSSKPTPTFNAEQQRVDVSGFHAFKAPGPFDDRGPCPGLNALANHGYLPRSGRATVLDYLTATSSVYGMGIDLSTILGAYGGIFNGAVLGWSIGGKKFTGIGGSHGNYEGDSSPTRGDLYQYGTNSDVILSQFKELLDRQPDPETANYNVDVIIDHRAVRFNESVAKNPYFFYGPFTSFVAAAAHVLIPAMFSNHSVEHPNGILNQDVLKSFFAVSGPNDDLTYTRGHERIPDNWYRRAMNDPYGFAQAGPDIDAINAKYPYTVPIGCNMGEVNTFTPIDTFNTTLKYYDFANPLDSVCYAVALVGTVANEIPLVGLLGQMLLLPIQNVLDCPTAPAVNESVGEACPGYSFRGGPTADIAPGAIQD